ncbi:MAG: serine/threonine protein phosphatase [Clostridiales bacterium]|nr:serine/threonine protein phosphatase [Clostridiales bacterium]
MRVYGISDLHLSFSEDKPMDIFGMIWEDHWIKIKDHWEKTVREEDVVLIPGDISWASSLSMVSKDLYEIGSMKGRKIIIRGNHDYWCSSSTGLGKIRNIMPQNMYFLRNDAIKLGKYIFCGTRGWTVPENNIQITNQDEKILNREVSRMKTSLDAASRLIEDKEDVLIAMIHYPPFNSMYENSVFTKLFKNYGVRKVVYGHIHGQTSKSTLNFSKEGIEYYLLSCDLRDNKLTLIAE